MDTTPKHRIERTETPWWWFGQPWRRPANRDDPLPDEPTPDEEYEDEAWRAMAP